MSFSVSLNSTAASRPERGRVGADFFARGVATGFPLTVVEPPEARTAIEATLAGRHDIERRMLLDVLVESSDPALDGPSLADARSAGLLNLKGHRSVGGMRASIYNAMPDEGVDELVGFMRDFAASAG